MNSITMSFLSASFNNLFALTKFEHPSWCSVRAFVSTEFL